MHPSSTATAVDSGERRGPEGKRQKNQERRRYGTFPGEEAGRHRGTLRVLQKVARQGSLLELVTKQIEVSGNGADLKRPGNARALVGCVGQHSRHKDRDEQNQDQDSQSLHIQTRLNNLALYLMKGIALSIRSTGIGKLIIIPQGRFDKIWKLQTREGMQTPSPAV